MGKTLKTQLANKTARKRKVCISKPTRIVTILLSAFLLVCLLVLGCGWYRFASWHYLRSRIDGVIETSADGSLGFDELADTRREFPNFLRPGARIGLATTDSIDESERLLARWILAEDLPPSEIYSTASDYVNPVVSEALLHAIIVDGQQDPDVGEEVLDLLSRSASEPEIPNSGFILSYLYAYYDQFPEDIGGRIRSVVDLHRNSESPGGSEAHSSSESQREAFLDMLRSPSP